MGIGVRKPGNVSKKFQKNISSRKGDIPILASFQQVSKPTKGLRDIQEICNYCKIMQKHPRNVSKNFQKNISTRTGDIPILASFQQVSKSTNRPKDMQKIYNHLEIVYKHLRKVSKKFQKYISSRTGDISILA